MIEKVSFTTAGKTEPSISFNSGKELIKQAADLRPDVEKFASTIKAEPNSIFVLLHALGAFEAYGSNRNGDATKEDALNYVPSDWTGDPSIDKIIAKTWGYGWPTYYNAHVYANHCFPGDTEVLTDGGVRIRIEDIREGQKVMTHAGRLREVLKTHHREYSGELVTIEGPGIGRIRCTPEHPFLLIRKEELKCAGKNRCTPTTHNNSYRCEQVACAKARKPLDYKTAWVAAKDIRRGDFVLFTHRTFCSKKKSVSPSFAWLLGLFMAEGCWLYKRGKLVGASITIGEHEEELAERLVSAASELDVSVAGPYKHAKNHTLLFNFRSSFTNTLTHYIEGRYSHERRFASSVFDLDAESMMHVVGGLIDGDGHQYRTGPNNGVVRLRSSSRGLLQDVKELLLLCSIPAAVSHDSKSGWVGGYLAKESGVVRIGRQFSQELSKYALKVENVPAKKRCSQAFPLQGSTMLQVKKVGREPFVGLVHNLEVDEDNTYTVDGIAVHNCNKDPNKRIGDVEFVTWNPDMLRVELVVRIDRGRAKQFGGEWAVKRLDGGSMVDVSMGMRVPFDLASTTINWDIYNAAVASYDPAFHTSIGQAVLSYHRRSPIPGLSVTRKDYPDDIKLRMNKVHPDGTKNFVYNTLPRMFDISVVFVGAEKPAKTMHKFASACQIIGEKCATCRGKNCANKVVPPSAYVVDMMSKDMPKTAAEKSATAHKVGRLVKRSEIDKKVPPTFGDASVAAMTDREEDLPKDILDQMAGKETDKALSTPAMLGMKLKPREFQRIILIRIGRKELADDMDEKGEVFPKTDKTTHMPDLNQDGFSHVLAKALMPFMSARSSFGPYLKARAPEIAAKPAPSPDKEKSGALLDKIAAAYNGYLGSLSRSFEKVASSGLYQHLEIRDELFGSGLVKEGSSIIDEFTLEYMKG